MKTKLFLVVALFILTQSVRAQSSDVAPIKFGVGAVVGIPVADASDFFNGIYGADLQLEFNVATSVAVIVDAGYVEFAKKKGVYGNSGLFPVLGGVKYYFSNKCYGAAQAGLSFPKSGDDGSAFTFVPAIGYQIADKVDLSIRYQSATKDGWNNGFVGLRIGYTF